MATVALAVASLCQVAVPKLSGDLIDVCIRFGQGSYDAGDAKHKLNGQSLQKSLVSSVRSHDHCKMHSQFLWHAGMLYKILIVLAVGGVASGLRSWLVPIFVHLPVAS